MKIINASTEILNDIDGGRILKSIELAGRVCYKSEDKITDESAKTFVTSILKRGHEAVIEHESVSVRFICDRGVSHEIVRHRIASYCQESTRYVNYGKAGEATFILPAWIADGVGTYHPEWEGCLGKHDIDPYVEGSAESWWFWHCATSERDYLKLLDMGWTPQQARSVLPNSLKTEIVVTMNLREWRHFFKLRTAKTAHPDMRVVAIDALNKMKVLIPIVFKDIVVEK